MAPLRRTAMQLATAPTHPTLWKVADLRIAPTVWHVAHVRVLGCEKNSSAAAFRRSRPAPIAHKNELNSFKYLPECGSRAAY
jgi:hypothetical protein